MGGRAGKNRTRKAAPPSEKDLLLREAAHIVCARGKMLAPSCEVVLHDLSNPEHAILAIENPISGRKIGQSTAEIGIARIKNPDFPTVVQNYANTLPDGRAVKSTSISLRDSSGNYVAAICLNLDISLFDTMRHVLEQITRTQEKAMAFTKRCGRARWKRCARRFMALPPT